MGIAEVLIAVGIIGFGLVALGSAVPLAAYGVQEGNQLSTATLLADQRLEQVRSRRWEAADPVSGLPVDTVGLSASDGAAPVGDPGVTFADENPLPGPYANYARAVRVSNCTAAPGCGGIAASDMRQVTVTVSYRPMTGAGIARPTARKSVALTAYITRR